MNATKKRGRLRLARLLLLTGLVAFLGLTPADAQEPSYDLSWFTVDCGGGSSGEGSYALQGTAGQPDAGAMSESTYTLAGGFWGGAAAAAGYDVFLPLLLRVS